MTPDVERRLSPDRLAEIERNLEQWEYAGKNVAASLWLRDLLHDLRALEAQLQRAERNLQIAKDCNDDLKAALQRAEEGLDNLHAEVSRWVYLDGAPDPSIGRGDTQAGLEHWKNLAVARAEYVEEATRAALPDSGEAK